MSQTYLPAKALHTCLFYLVLFAHDMVNTPLDISDPFYVYNPQKIKETRLGYLTFQRKLENVTLLTFLTTIAVAVIFVVNIFTLALFWTCT